MSIPSIGVVDYGSGNLRSVSKALEAAGASVRLATDRNQFEHFDAIVVPGVGSFGDCARNLRRSGMWDPLREWIRAGRPYLGICLGYQLLFGSSEETPDEKGLGVLPGRVVRFPANGLKVPHMGWNTLEKTRGPLFDGTPPAPAFYFVHSYFPVPDDETCASSLCTYGGPFAASVSLGTLHAVQFHPEKSQAAGLALLRNFLATIGTAPAPVAPLENRQPEIENSHASPARH